MVKFNNFKIQKTRILKKGFTMLELIVAIFITTVGILSAHNAVSQIVYYTRHVSNKFTAAYLAKEGIEIVRNIRDKNILNGNLFNKDLGQGNYEADYDDTGLSPFGDNYLKTTTGGFYSYSSTGSETKFKRKITITNGTDGSDGDDIIDYITVSVSVMWEEKGKLYTITAQEKLYDWYY